MDGQLEAARRALLENARAVSRHARSKVDAWRGIVKHRVAGVSRCLPGYIPFIGERYFPGSTKGRRILAYALSQNIRPEDDFALRWAEDWHLGKGYEALDRQNRCYQRDRSIAVEPFDTGHIPIICGLVRWLLNPSTSPTRASIFDEVACTNLSKYSFRSPDGRETCDSAVALQWCWDHFGARELAVLQPDVILCAGGQVSAIVRTAVRDTRRRVLAVPFPSLRVINRGYRRDQPSRREVAALRSMLSPADLDRQVSQARLTLGDVLERDAYFFHVVFKRLEESLHRGSA